MLVHSLILSLLVVGSYAAPAETSSKSVSAKSGDDSKKVDDLKDKAAASLEEQDKARTHHLLNYLRPSYGFGSYPAFPVPQYVPSYIQSAPLIKPIQAPVSSYFSAPIVAPVAPVAPIAPVHVAPASHVSPVAQLAPVHVAPVSQVAPVAPAPVVSQTTFTKPFLSYNTQLIKKPTYTVSQQVVHRPVVTEVQHIVRRPVVAELQEVIHKPYLTEYQQVIRLPTYTAHVVKKPSYSSVQHETVQSPLILNSEQYHVVDKPSSQVLQLPTQFVQPYTTEVVQVPSVHHQTETQTTVHHPPAVAVQPAPVASSVSYLPSASYGISSISSIPSASYGVSGISSVGNYGGNYGGSYEGNYGSIYGSSYGGSIGSIGGYDDESYGYYLSPSSSCRGGDCEVKRDSEGREIVVMPSSGYYNSQEMMPTTYSAYNPNVIPSPMISNSQMYWPSNMPWFKNMPENGGNSKPSSTSQGRAASDFDGLMNAEQSFMSQTYPVQAFEQPAEIPNENSIIPKFTESLINNEQFRNILSDAYSKAKSADEEGELKKVWNQLTKEQKDKLRFLLNDEMKKTLKVDEKSPAENMSTVDTKTDSQKQ